MISFRSIAGGLGNNLFQFAYIYAKCRENEIPDIYVQDPAYFDKYESELKSIMSEGIGFLPYVSIHIRRGDYVNNHFYVDLSETDYYERAMELFPDKNFLVFSDDPTFAKKRFAGERFQIIEGQTETEDFNMMASCESNIIANSSFSWWAAYVNPNHAKRVVAPIAWHPDGIERTKVPGNWIIL